MLDTAVIPCGGLGTRLHPITRWLPKEMLPVALRPVLHWALDEAAEAGLLRAIIITNPHKPVLEAAPPPRVMETGQPLNVKVELTITEELGSAAPAKKMVSLTVADRQNSYVRSGGDVRVGDRYRTVNINVDARPTILRCGRCS